MQALITQRLTEVFDPVHLEVLNESHGGQHLESHFKVIIVAKEFVGKSRIKQHQMVQKELLGSDGNLLFHSLSIVPFTPDKWNESSDNKDRVPPSPKCAGGDGLPKRR